MEGWDSLCVVGFGDGKGKEESRREEGGGSEGVETSIGELDRLAPPAGE